MKVANCEADELLMAACTSVGRTEYWIQIINGGKRPAGRMYYFNGRFDRYKLIRRMVKLGYILDQHYTIVAESICDDLNKAIMLTMRKMTKIKAVLSSHFNEEVYVKLWLGPSNGSNFRYKSAVTKPYKGGRAEKPIIYSDLRTYMIEAHGAEVIDGYEGDDALGIFQSNNTVAVHRDKDICQIPGIHYNPTLNKIYEVKDPGELNLSECGKYLKGTGILFFFAQMLTGDRTDNIPSVPHPRYKGYGAKTVYKLLQGKTERQAFEEVLIIFKATFNNGWQERIMEQADLVWICRNKGEYGHDIITRMLMK